MDDITTLLQTAACTSRLLKRLEALLTWARLKIKPAKSCSLSNWKGVRNNNISFLVNGEKIPLVAEHPVQSLGRLYTADLSDRHMVATVTSQLVDGLRKINQSNLLGKFKVWCYQYTLYQRVMWPLKLSDITASAAMRMDAKANNFIHKWFGLPRCLSNMALFGKNMLTLPLKSISLGYKQEKLLRFPLEITSTSLQPDIFIWSSLTKTVFIPWEDGMEAAFERKKDRYAELAAACSQAGSRKFTFPVEVGSRGYTGASAQRLFKSLGIRGAKLKRAIRDIAEEAEQGSFWLWLRRKDKSWGKQGS
ncbi:hypothetical protein ABVT39_007243 [Epinephelus coioides]